MKTYSWFPVRQILVSVASFSLHRIAALTVTSSRSTGRCRMTPRVDPPDLIFQADLRVLNPSLEGLQTLRRHSHD